MAEQRNRKDNSATWLVTGLGGKGGGSTRKPREGGRRAKDESWLAVPEPEAGGGTGKNGRTTSGRGISRPRPRAGESRVSAKLRHARNQLQVQADQIEGLQDRVAELETALKGKPARNAAGGGKAGSRRGRTQGSFDANSATFEELRELGLSVTQSARVIGHRETNGGFNSEADIKRLKGLPKETIAVLLEASSRPAKAASSTRKRPTKSTPKKSSGSRGS